MRPLKPTVSTLLAATAVGLALTGCRYGQTQSSAAAPVAWPATTEAPYPQTAQAPRGYYDTAPPPARAPVARLASYDDGWAWAERSYWLDQAFYDTPPDYGFYYDDYQPWVWQTDDRWAMYGDPYGDDYYYYYYQPGAVRPYFIRDDRYGYGYDNVGRLVTIFNLLTGQMMPQSFLYAQDPYATRYYQRAYLVREASLSAEPIVITRDIWLERQPTIVRTQNIWIHQATTQPAWVQYRARSGDRDLRRFEGVREQRLKTLVAAAPPQQQGDWLGRTFGGRGGNNRLVQTAALTQRGEARMADQLRTVERRQQQDRQDLARRMPADQRQAFEAQTRELRRVDRGNAAQIVRQQARDQQRLAQAPSAQARRDVQRNLADQARRGRDQAQRLARAEQQRQAQRGLAGPNRQEVRDQQRQAEAQSRQMQQQAQRQSEAQARQQRDQQRQAEAQARGRQQQAQRQAEAQARQQQQQAQRQAEAQARGQQQQAQRQAEAQARGQQQQAQRQAEAQARGQQQQAQRQAEAQARQQQQQAQRQAEAQARGQQQAQRQAEAQARGQQQQAQRQAEAQARQQQAQAQKQAKERRDQEANADPNAKVRGRDKKG